MRETVEGIRVKAGTLDYKLDALLSYFGETLGARRALARICLQSRGIAESLANRTPVDQFNVVQTLGTPARCELYSNLKSFIYRLFRACLIE